MHHPHFRIHWYTHPCSPSLSPVTLLEVCVQCYSFIDVFFQKKTRLQSFYILCSCTIKCMSNKTHILLLYFYIFLYKNTNKHIAASHSVSIHISPAQRQLSKGGNPFRYLQSHHHNVGEEMAATPSILAWEIQWAETIGYSPWGCKTHIDLVYLTPPHHILVRMQVLGKTARV